MSAYKQKYIKHLEKTGYDVYSQGCEKCHRTTAFTYDVHHIVYRSEAPKHKNLHDIRNLIFVCNKCHDWFHSKKDRRDYLIRGRKLYELFDFIPVVGTLIYK